MQLRETGLPEAAGVFAMAVVGFPLGLLAGDAQLCDVDDDDIIARVHVRRVLRLMLAAQPRGDLHREPPQDLALSVDHIPAVLDLARFCRVGLHAPNCEKLRILPKKNGAARRELRRIHQRRRVEEANCIPATLCSASMLRCNTRRPNDSNLNLRTSAAS